MFHSFISVLYVMAMPTDQKSRTVRFFRIIISTVETKFDFNFFYINIEFTLLGKKGPLSSWARAHRLHLLRSSYAAYATASTAKYLVRRKDIFRPPIPVFPNPRSTDRYRSVDQMIPGRPINIKLLLPKMILRVIQQLA